jgi:hypothetical protein
MNTIFNFKVSVSLILILVEGNIRTGARLVRCVRLYTKLFCTSVLIDFVMVKKGFNKIVKKIIVIPGDEIKTLNNEATETKILLGPGLVRDGNLVKATKCGVFVENVFKGRTLLYVNSSQKRVFTYISKFRYYLLLTVSINSTSPLWKNALSE